MRVVIAPDKFAGTLSAPEAAVAIAEGWAALRATDSLTRLPMSDGGPGFLDVLDGALPDATLLAVPVADPLGREVPAAVLLHHGTAYVESAQAVGLHLLTAEERDPEHTNSAGLASLLAAAASSGAERVVVGLGGSATNDGGRGMVEALEARGLIPELSGIDLVIASDVGNPLLGISGATAVFAPQKGAGREAVARLEQRMKEWVVQRPGFEAVAGMAGAGAAGGIGAALLWLGGRRLSGAGLVADALGLAAALEGADLVVTGEGTYDFTSLRGKVVGLVASSALEAALPCVVIAGQVAVGQREAAAHGVDEAIALADVAGSVEAAQAAAGKWLTEAAKSVARRWGRP